MDDRRPRPAGSRPPAAATAAAVATTAGVTLRPLASHEDYHACYELQLVTWGRDFQEGVPPSVLKISQRVGGIAAGAFGAGGELLGYVYGLTGVRPPGSSRSAARAPAPGGRPRPELLHWSHMLAVAPEARDLGLGTRLKLYQRELLLPLGVEVVEWTYDPLEARNAHLNLNRLGAEAVEYVEDMYKGEMGSDLARGIGTDRFIVSWRIAGERVRDALERLRLENGAGGGGGAGGGAGGGSGSSGGGGGSAAAPERFLDAPAIEPAASGSAGAAGEAGAPPLPPAPRVRIEIPARIQEFKERQPESALAWRLLTRRAFQAYLARGYRVTAFWRDAAGRCWYGVEATGR
jgi:predicted GNAT superfamily acetyltransferase